MDTLVHYLSTRAVLSLLGGPKGVPYLEDIIELYDDPAHPERDWCVYQKVMGYYERLLEAPHEVHDLPPITIVGGVLKDGAHRLSTLNLLGYTIGKEWLDIPIKVHLSELTLT